MALLLEENAEKASTSSQQNPDEMQENYEGEQMYGEEGQEMYGEEEEMDPYYAE